MSTGWGIEYIYWSEIFTSLFESITMKSEYRFLQKKKEK